MIGERMGNHVRLSEFDSFKPSVKSNIAEISEAVTVHNVTKVAFQFRPGKEFKKVIENTEFEKASD